MMLTSRFNLTCLLSLSFLAGNAWASYIRLEKGAAGNAVPAVGQASEPLWTAEPWSTVVGQEHVDSMTLSWEPLVELQKSLQVMQTEWFEVWVGTWPTAIDWTAAVMGTYVSAVLRTYTKALESATRFDSTESLHQQKAVENEIDAFFSQTIAYYFGEDAFSIRKQAYDDMLWVVLGWLESIKFINVHTKLHRSAPSKPWYGFQFVEAFAHRAHIFYSISSKGWDTDVCGGGMTWNPNLTPYKNAITNMLWISASAAMYLYFPGDHNESPFILHGVQRAGLASARPHDPKFLKAAIDGYAWLKTINMTNGLGLYVDGFHVTDWGKNGSAGTKKCDDRNEMVYTYNQGVLLSGLRWLWESTGDRDYLKDGHKLIHNTIAATGWLVDSSTALETSSWAGLGRAGVLEDFCDSKGNCNQNGQTFKGIYFHHLTHFCEPLPLTALIPGRSHHASKELALLHRQSCREYALWVAHNAKAAMATKDERGRFGAWWGFNISDEMPPLPLGSIDYRNDLSKLFDPVWLGPGGFVDVDLASTMEAQIPFTASAVPLLALPGSSQAKIHQPRHNQNGATGDVQDRGRGRTVETQGGGVSILRTLWELLNR